MTGSLSVSLSFCKGTEKGLSFGVWSFRSVYESSLLLVRVELHVSQFTFGSFVSVA